MKKDALEVALSREVEKWSNKRYEELCTITGPVCYDQVFDEERYQVEVQVLERNSEYVHLSIAVDDGSFRRTLSAVARSILVHKNGNVEK